MKRHSLNFSNKRMKTISQQSNLHLCQVRSRLNELLKFIPVEISPTAHSNKAPKWQKNMKRMSYYQRHDVSFKRSQLPFYTFFFILLFLSLSLSLFSTESIRIIQSICRNCHYYFNSSVFFVCVPLSFK